MPYVAESRQKRSPQFEMWSGPKTNDAAPVARDGVKSTGSQVRPAINDR